MADDLEALRAKFLYERNALTGAQRALEATPEYAARESAQERYEEAEEAFAGHGATYEYAGFCEGCGIPLKQAEAEYAQIGTDPGDTAPFCKDAAACAGRWASPLRPDKRAGE